MRMLVDRLAGDGSCSQWQAVREIAPKLGAGMSHCAVTMRASCEHG